MSANDPKRTSRGLWQQKRLIAFRAPELLGGAIMKTFGAICALTLALLSFPALTAEYPAPKQGDWIARDFKFHTGEVRQAFRWPQNKVPPIQLRRHGRRTIPVVV